MGFAKVFSWKGKVPEGSEDIIFGLSTSGERRQWVATMKISYC